MKYILKLLVTKNLEDNIFNLLNAFVANDKKTLFSIYEDFMTLNEDEMRIISAISNKLEEILYTKILMNKNAGKDEIATYFKVKPGRAYYMMEAARKIKEENLKSLKEIIMQKFHENGEKLFDYFYKVVPYSVSKAYVIACLQYKIEE